MTGIGSTLMAAHLAGKDLSPGQAIKAKCADCTNRKRRFNPSRVGMKPGEKNCSELCNDSEVEE